MKKVLLLTTGGTIASRPTQQGLIPDITCQDIIQMLPVPRDNFLIDSRDIFSLDSSNIQPEEWQFMAEIIAEALPHYDGIIITHGTDTMAYTASALSYMLQNLDKPIVLTRAQVPIEQMFTDVFLLKLIPGTSPDIFDWLQQKHYRGIVIEAFGMGGTHFERRNLIPKLKKLVANDVSIIVCSQCLYEKSDLSLYEVGRRLLECGVIPGRDMTTEAIVTKLMWALGQTQNPTEVRQIFDTNYAGEVTL